MKPLFSLYVDVTSLMETVSPSAVTFGSPYSFLKETDGRSVKALSLESPATLADAVRLLVHDMRQTGEWAPCLLVRHENRWGRINSAALLTTLYQTAEHQSALLDTLLETMSEATTVVDAENTVVYWNSAAEKIYELDRNQVVGTPLDRHFASESIRLTDALRDGSSVQRVYHVPRPDRHVLINSAPIRLRDRVIGALSIEQDITELVRLNEELAHTTAHLETLQQEMTRYQPSDDPFFQLKGHSLPFRHTIQMARKVAQTDATVLLYGESGVGKELFARAIHQSSKRKDKPFIAINCGAIPAALFESELFGYQGGAFTGAEKKGKPGKLELAHGGTLFLDEVGELPLELQVKLLRALQERQFYRVGGTEPITVDTRVIAATNRQLEKMIAEGRFREDLYYRLNVFTLEIPPLRDRREDILELVQNFLQEYSSAYGQPIPRLGPGVTEALLAYHWPGNVRELRNVMERLCILQENGMASLEHLPLSVQNASPQPVFTSRNDPALLSRPFPPALREEDERQRILAALERTYGNKKAAAELLGISRGTLYNKLQKYGIPTSI